MTNPNNRKKMRFAQIIEAMLKNRRLRLTIVKRSFLFFFHYYFMGSDEEKSAYPLADFHREMIHLLEDDKIPVLLFAGFRGSAKSTIAATLFPLWAILGETKIKYVVLLSKTEAKAQMILKWIKDELETNKLLKVDLGPFREERGPWNTTSLYLDKYGAKITIASTEQSIRGFRHLRHRPQLIICDDLEDIESTKTLEQRDKLYQWLLGDVIPAGSEKTRVIILGGILHDDSLFMRLQKSIDEGTMDGCYRKYPFLDKDGKPLWPQRFKTQEDIDRERKKVGDELVFQREHMLNPMTDSIRVVTQDMILEYEHMPRVKSDDYQGTLIGVDPAASKRNGADCTAMVVASVFGRNRDDMKVYIHPNPINEQLDFNQIQDRILLLNETHGASDLPPIFIVEDNGTQKWLGDILERRSVCLVRFKVGNVDKESRLRIATALLRSRQVFLPKHGAEELRKQLVNFNFMAHDDLVDAFSMAIITAMRQNFEPTYPMLFFLEDGMPELRTKAYRGEFFRNVRDKKKKN